VLDGPTSQGLPMEAPGNIGSWVGWQIIKKYVAANNITNLENFCKQKINAAELLQKSGYTGR
jgi:hypothetical protein